MKNFFKSLAICALAALTFASCQKENADGNMDDQSSIVSINLTSPLMGTKTFADGNTVNVVHVHVYQHDANGNLTYIAPATQGAAIETPSKDVAMSAGAATYSTRLVTGQTYTFVFWAEKKDNGHYTYNPDTKTIAVNYDNAAGNDESRDAFYAVLPNVTITGAYSASVALKRPFAQINFGASDYEAAKAAGIEVTGAAVELTGIANSINLLDGSVSGSETVTFANADLSSDPNDPNATLRVANVDYKYVAMDYVLVGKKSKTLSDVTLTLAATGTQSSTPEYTYTNVPLQGNYRTNIVGNLFTSPADITITVDPAFGNPDENIITGVANLDAANTAFANGATAVTVEEITSSDPDEIVLPATTAEVSLTLPAAPNGKTITIKYPDSASNVPATVNIKAVNAASLTINAPQSHVELNGITVTTLTASTSSTTLVVGADVTVGTLTVKAGSAVIYGTVTTLVKEEGAGEIEWHVTNVADVVNAANKADVIVFDTDMNFGNQSTININKPTKIINNAKLTFNTAWQFDNYSELTLEGEGTIHSTTRGIVQNYGTNQGVEAKLTVNGGFFSMEQNNRGSVFYNYPGAQMSLNGITVNSTFYAVYAAGNVTINGGKFTSSSHNGNGNWAYTIKAAEGGNLIINNAEVYGVQGCISGNNASTVTLNNVHAEARNIEGYTGNKAFRAVYSSGSTVTTINGGTYLSDNTMCVNVGDAYDVEAPNGTTAPIGKIIIKSGTFSDPSALHYLADGADVKIEMTADNEITSEVSVSQNAVINLNDHKLKVSAYFTTIESGSLAISNGSIECVDPSVNNPQIRSYGSSHMSFDDVDMTSNTSAVYVGDKCNFSIKNSTIKAKFFGISTNASDPNQNPTINVDNCTITGSDPILVNIPCSLTVKDSNLNGTMHGAVVRGGTATFTGCHISLNYPNDNANVMANYFDDKSKKWGQGNEVNLAAMTIGNKHATSYQYPTNVSLVNTEVKVEGDYANYFPSLYAYANSGEGLGVTLTYDENCTFTGGTGINYGSTNIVVNGTAVNAE